MGNYQSYFQFFTLVAVLKPVPAGLTFPEQANFLSFWHIYHKSQGWKKYEYRTITLYQHVGKATEGKVVGYCSFSTCVLL